MKTSPLTAAAPDEDCQISVARSTRSTAQCLRLAFFASLAFLNGLVVSVQMGTSGVLTKSLGSPVYAACLNILVATSLEALMVGCLAAWSLLRSRTEPEPREDGRTRSSRWYAWFGGVIAAYTLTTGIFVGASIGVALTSLVGTVGNVSTSVLVDYFGILGERKPLRVTTALSLFVLTVGVSMSIAADAPTNIAELGALRAVIYLLLVFLMGTCVPFLSVANSQLRLVLGHTLKAASFSDFVTFTVLFAIACVVMATSSEGLELEDLSEVPFWAWLGGPCAACFTCIVIIVPETIGVAAFTCIYICGQEFWGVLVDASGFFAAKRSPSPLRVAGMTVAVCGAVLFTIAGAKTDRRGEAKAGGSDEH